MAARYPAALARLAEEFGGAMPGVAQTELTLNGNITDVALSLVVNEAIPASWPQVGWITIDSEVLAHSAYNAGTKTFTVTRGQQGTTGAAHTSGATVGKWLTRDQWNQIVDEIIAVQTRLGVNPEGLGPARVQWYWQPSFTEETTVVGTGTATVIPAQTQLQLNTGATSASSAGLRQTVTLSGGATGEGGTGKVRHWSGHFYIGNVDANTDARLFLTDEYATTQPSLTVRHLGIKSVAGVTAFSTADGTTEQTTDITAFVSAGSVVRFAITYDGTTARCYINGFLRATHATNVPSSVASAPCVFRAHILNSAAAAKLIAPGAQTVISDAT